MRFASEGNAHAPLTYLKTRSLSALTGIALLSALSAATLTGCGLGKIDTSSSDVAQVIPAFKGTMMGGQTPIINSTVKIYSTGTATNCGTNGTGTCSASDSAGYGAGTLLQEATQQGSSSGQDTDASGSFSFPGGYRCPTGEFAYIVGSGGQPGNISNPVNSKILLVAALGRCEDLYNAVTGSGYTSAPTVVFTNAPGDTTGSGAAATATITSGGYVSSVFITSVGSGYTASPTITLSGGGGSGATAAATMSVSAVNVVSTGVNYTQNPTVSFSGGGGSGAAATATEVGGGVTTITITNPGSGYTSAPTVTLTPASGDTTGNSATATATLQLNAVTLTNTGYSNYAGANVVVNEITTVAAGYALGNFATVPNSGTPSSTQVLIGAPATNNAAKINGFSTGCVSGVNGCTTTAAAGLYHAFLNAANLANPFSTSTLSSAPSTLAGNANAVVPRELINTIGNILANCVDTAGTGSQCNSSYLPATTDTFSMVKALAANPTLGGSGTAATNLLTLASSSGAPFAPVVTAVRDFSIAINYPAAAADTLVYDFTGGLDANDVYYIGNAAGSGVAPVNVVSLSSNGSVLGSSASNANFKNTYSMTMDALGNGYFGNGSGSGNNALGVFTTSAGVPSAITPISIITSTQGSQGTGLLKVYAIAADLANNVWVTGATASTTAPASTTYTYKCPASITTATICVYEPGGNNTVSSSGGGLAVDPDQNIWIGTNNTLYVLSNTGTVSNPTYGSSIAAANTVTTSTIGGGPVLGITFAGSPYIGYVSEYKTSGVAGNQPVTPTLSGASVTAITASAASGAATNSGPYVNEADGNGTIWSAGYNDHDVAEFLPGIPATYKVNPCLGGTTGCATIFTGTTNKPTSVSIDSTGSIWATNPGGPQVVQIIGSAGPTWPLLSLGKVGKP